MCMQYIHHTENCVLFYLRREIFASILRLKAQKNSTNGKFNSALQQRWIYVKSVLNWLLKFYVLRLLYIENVIRCHCFLFQFNSERFALLQNFPRCKEVLTTRLRIPMETSSYKNRTSPFQAGWPVENSNWPEIQLRENGKLLFNTTWVWYNFNSVCLSENLLTSYSSRHHLWEKLLLAPLKHFAFVKVFF